MRKVERDLARIREHLRVVIRERGFIQTEVQDVLGWGRSYISQLLTGQKQLRVEQVLMILKVIGVEPAAFYGEIFASDKRSGHQRAVDVERANAEPPVVEGEGRGAAKLLRLREQFEEALLLFEESVCTSSTRLTRSIETMKHITANELAHGIEQVHRELLELQAGRKSKQEETDERQS